MVLFSFLGYLLPNLRIAGEIWGFQALEWVIEVDTLGRESRRGDNSGGRAEPRLWAQIDKVTLREFEERKGQRVRTLYRSS